MFVVYAIYNKSHNKFYIGQTENLEKRLLEHNTGAFKSSYTSRFPGKWVLLYYEESRTRPEALRREKQLKSYRGREFIKNCRGSSVG